MKGVFLEIISPFVSSRYTELDNNTIQNVSGLARKHSLFCFIYWRLLEERKEQFADRAKSFLDGNKLVYMENAAFSIRAEVAEQRIVEQLQKENIPSVLFRGNVLATELYGTPNCRSSVDIDILIRQEDVFKVDSLLKRSEYVTECERPLAYDLGRIHHAAYFPIEKNIPIEIHWNLGVPNFFKITSRDIWHGVLRSDQGQHKLSPGMLIVMLLIHHHSHSFRELRILVDLLWAFYKYDKTVDWNVFANQLKKIGLIKTTRIVLDQLVDLWGDQAREMKAVYILDQAIKDSGIKVPRFLRTYFNMEIERTEPYNLYKDKFFARLLLDRRSTIIASYFKTLFPPPDAIKALYEDERMWMLPSNYLRFMWWRVEEWMGKDSED